MNLENFFKKNQEKLVKIHWNETINKYIENITLSKILLDNLSEEEFFTKSKEFFNSINRDIDNYVESAKNPSYQIAIVGAIKAGKSTLINALIGSELASVNVTPETATLTKFKYSKKNSLNVKFYSKEEWNEIWNDAQNKKAEIFLEQYYKLNAEEIKNELLDKKEIYEEFNSIEEMKDKISKWSSSKEKEHYFVKELEIGLKNLKLPEQICLVDTPGLNDIIEYRSNITKNYIDSANSVIVCVNAKTLRNEELVTISRVFSKARYKKDKIYILGTQIDTMNSINDWEKQKEDWLNILERKEYFESRKKAIEHLKGISAYLYSKAIELNENTVEDIYFDLIIPKKIINREKAKEIINNKDFSIKTIEETKKSIIDYSKIEKIKAVIENELLKNFNNSLVQDFVEKYKILKSEIEKFRDEYKIILEDKTKDLQKTAEELSQKIENEKNKIKEIEKINENLEQKIKETTENFNLDFSKLTQNFKELEKEIKKINIE